MARSSRYRQQLGSRGEELAARWYQARGYAVIERNWRCREGEIDLVVRTGSTVVVCEVKTRATDRCGSALEAVSRAKRLRLRRLAARVLSERGLRCDVVRFDVAAVVRTEVTVVEGAW